MALINFTNIFNVSKRRSDRDNFHYIFQASTYFYKSLISETLIKNLIGDKED